MTEELPLAATPPCRKFVLTLLTLQLLPGFDDAWHEATGDILLYDLMALGTEWT